MTDRRARLAALASRAGRNQEPSFTGDQPEEKRQRVEEGNSVEVALPVKDENEKVVNVMDKNDSGEKEDPLEKALREAEMKEAQERRQDKSSEIVDLAPKKINWDLRRDCEKRIEKLERKTQRKIVEMLRKRLESEAAEDLD